MTDPTEIARVAARLTRAQREAVLACKPGATMPYEAIIRQIRVRSFSEGIFEYAGDHGGEPHCRLTRFGITLHHILREKSGG